MHTTRVCICLWCNSSTVYSLGLLQYCSWKIHEILSTYVVHIVLFVGLECVRSCDEVCGNCGVLHKKINKRPAKSCLMYQRTV